MDERLGFSDLIARHLTGSRRGKNTQLPLADLLRPSVYSRIAGYEDVNDAERLSQDPTFRLIGSEKIWERGAAADSIPKLDCRLPDGALESGVQNCGLRTSRWAYTALCRAAKMEILDNKDYGGPRTKSPEVMYLREGASRDVYTAYALMKFINSNDSELRFRDFRIRRLASVGDRTDAQAQFPGARIYGTEWLYEREYQDSEVSRDAFGFGKLPNDLEDTLLLLRLYRPGDIIFIRHSIREPNGELSTQFPQRIAADITTASFFKLGQAECNSWDNFASELTASQSWRSQWFATARRFFLYGGAKEFNTNWNEVDRVVDYMIALEAALVPEQGFGIGQRLRKRAICLLGLQDEAANGANRILRDFYGVRSALVHGAPVSDQHKKTLQQMAQFELLVRQILVAALRQVPPDEDGRKQRLAGWYDVPETLLIDEVLRLFKALPSLDAKQRLQDVLRSSGDK